VERGSFRENLFYRLGVFDIPIPPLRDRASDMVPLSDSFLHEIGRSFGRPAAAVTREARAALLEYEWPGLTRTQLHLRIRKYGLDEAATAQSRSSAARA
jgi:transcriptional regulator with PAS, ATPase and Fis domain